MERSEEQSMGALPAYLIGFWSLNVTSRVVTLDTSMSGFFGIEERDGLAGVPAARMRERTHPDDRQALADKTQSAIDETGYLVHTYRVTTGHQAAHWVRTLGRCFADAAGKPSHVAGVLLDIGARPADIPQVQIIDNLVIAREIALAAKEGLLARLIEAVLLETGRSLARRDAGLDGH